MALVTKGRTFVSGEVVTPTKLNSLVDSATVTQIVNADIDAAAGIVDTKLATIATSGKVANSATTATSANTANAIVARDGSGAVSVGAITSGAISSTGNMSVTGAITASGNITAFSDARLKANVETIPNALSLVNRLRGVRYDRTDTGEHQIGVIAQETLQVIPEVVIPVAETGYLSVAYGNIVAVLIEAIKELFAQVESLKK
jgi:hypothetical protein